MTVGEPSDDAEGSYCFRYRVKICALSVQIAGRRNASERPLERRRAERKAIAEAQKIVAIWNGRQAGGSALWFYPTIGAAIAAVAQLSARFSSMTSTFWNSTAGTYAASPGRTGAGN